MKVQIQLVTFNSEEFIIECLKFVLEQSLASPVLVIDNASSDRTVSMISECYPQVKVEQNPENIGFVAHNIGFRNTQADYILVLNPDVIITHSFVEEMIRAIEQDKRIGMVTGKILKLDHNKEYSMIIDSIGLELTKKRSAIDRGQGEIDRGQFEQEEFVFGACGAAALYRREMLEDIQVNGEYFDESFFAYKEDVDLAWRAQLRSWKCLYTPKAIAYHARGWDSNARKRIPRKIQIHSLKNRYLMLLKNDTLDNFLIHLPWILSYEIIILVHNLVKTPYLFLVWPKIFGLFKGTWAKRKQIMDKRGVDEKYMAQWFR